MGSGVTG